MIFNIIVLLIGAVILGAGVYYLVREKNDRESLKIYSVISGAGAVIVIAMILKITMEG